MARTETIIRRDHRTSLEEVDDAALSGKAALWLRGCRRLGRPERFDLLVGRARAPAIAGTDVRITRSLPPEDVDVVEGVPTLAVPRLLGELSRSLTDVELTAVIDDLLATAHGELRRQVHDRAVQLLPGRPRVARLIELTRPGAGAEFWSWLEREACRVLTERGVPAAEWNAAVHADDGSALGTCDAVWRDARVVVELDGLRFHSPPGQYRRDRAKDRRLGRHGWLVMRYTWHDVVERPDQVAAEVLEAISTRRR